MAKNKPGRPPKTSKSKKRKHKIEVYVRENPVKSAGIAAGIGVGVGWLLGKLGKKK